MKKKKQQYKVIKKFPEGDNVHPEVFLNFWDVAVKEVDKMLEERKNAKNKK